MNAKGSNRIKFYILNGFIAFLFLLPFVWIVSTSLKKPGEIAKYPPKWLPANITLDNYRTIFTFQEGIFSTYFTNSGLLTISTVFFVIIVSSLAGYGFSKLDIPFKNGMLMLILAAMMIPFHGLLIPLFSIIKNLNLLNTHIALIIIYVTFQLPFTIYMMKNSFDSVPTSIRESALMDGAGELRTFVRVFLPLVWPGLATVAIFSAYTTWNDFIIALIFANSNDLKTLNVGLTNLAVGEYGTNWGLLSSGSIISFIPIIILFAFLQRYFISGLTSGSVK